MEITTSRTGRYVPEWLGNRKLPVSDQAYIEYVNLSSDERRRYKHSEKPTYRFHTPEAKSDDELTDEAQQQIQDVEVKIWVDNAGMTKAMKPCIGNLTCRDEEGSVVEVQTWEQLLKIPATPENQLNKLTDEVERALPATQQEADTKNSE